MKKLIFVVNIVFLLLSCDNGGGMEETIENPVTITFDTDGGAEIVPMTVEAGSFVNLPTPQKEGYEFLGWYRIRDGNKEMFGDGVYPVFFHDITIYARFVIWYQFEVSNISSTVEEWEHNNVYNNEAYLVTYRWDNPTDGNFSHVAYAWSELAIDVINLEPGTDSFTRLIHKEVFDTPSQRFIYIKCVDKNGNQSKGIRYYIQ